jgi:hypothetical protein
MLNLVGRLNDTKFEACSKFALSFKIADDTGVVLRFHRELIRSGRLAEKIGLAFPTSHQQSRMPTGPHLSASVADLTHLIFVAMPMPPEFRVGTDLDGVHALGDFRRLKPRAHEIGSQYRPSFS